jgi:large subunit ribosomal protein L29
MKTDELRQLGTEELNKKAGELRRELMLARFAQANQQLKNPLKLRSLRREIARILTIVGEKDKQAQGGK